MSSTYAPDDFDLFFQRVFETRTLREAQDSYRQAVKKYPGYTAYIRSSAAVAAMRHFTYPKSVAIGDRVTGRNLI